MTIGRDPRGNIKRYKSFSDRFWDKVDKQSNGCWEWLGGTNKGYGAVSHEGSMKLAHRVAWRLLNGGIPSGVLVLHKCDNRRCVNPEHLYLGSYSDNNLDRAVRNPSNQWR